MTDDTITVRRAARIPHATALWVIGGVALLLAFGLLTLGVSIRERTWADTTDAEVLAVVDLWMPILLTTAVVAFLCAILLAGIAEIVRRAVVDLRDGE